MRSKAPLALMEQLVMILVFALAAVMCVRMFVLSDHLSRKNEAVSKAALAAQNVAEEIKSRGTAFSDLFDADSDDWMWADDAWVLAYDKDWDPVGRDEERAGVSQVYWLQIREEADNVPGLLRARIAVTDGKDELFQILVAWQEVSGHE